MFKIEEKNIDTKSILTISAHADDHIAAAGTLFKLRDQGYALYEVVLTNSNQGRDYRDPGEQVHLEGLRNSELDAATRFLGIKKVFKLHQPDLGLVYSRELVFELVKVIRLVRPPVAFIHNKQDWHPDHAQAFKLSSTAFKIAASGIQPELGAHHRTPIVLQMEGMIPTQADIVVDVTDYAGQKIKLWEFYQSQAQVEIKNYEEGLLKVRNYQLRKPGRRMAEAFQIDRGNPSVLFEE